jgi:cell division protein FtsW
MIYNKDKKNLFDSWWNSIDRLTLLMLISLIIFSMVMVSTASPAVADRIGVESFFFIRKQFVYLTIAIFMMVAISFLSLENIKRFALIVFILCLISLVMVLLIGTEVKGSKRWLYLAGISLQPSEITKPVFAVETAYILSVNYNNIEYFNFKLSAVIYGILVILLILQPDFGMVVTVSTVWGGQLFLAGLSIMFILAIVTFAITGVIGAYCYLPHVTKRIDSFLSPDKSENYQIKKSLEAFLNGGVLGKGPGEGTVKQSLPDSHTDFIFAVIGEEFGAIVCFIVILIFAFIVIRGIVRVMYKNDKFVILATSGLLMQFGFQAMINIGVALHMFPTKGMTLPFISYGGSSIIATSIGMGMVLAMTKKRYGTIKIGVKEYRLNG